MMAQCDFIATFLDRNVVENSAPKTRANRTVSLTLWYEALHYGISVALNYAKRDAAILKITREHVRRKARLFLIQIYSQHIKTHRCARLHVKQQFQHRIAVLAAGQANHYAISILNHAEVGNRVSDSAK